MSYQIGNPGMGSVPKKSLEMELFFIGLATKMLLNGQKVKDPI